MKKFILLFFGLILLLSCNKDTVRNTNPFIPNYSFVFDINLNLPAYSALNSNINPQLIVQENVGVSGIIVMKISETEYRAWEANCPNQYPSQCAAMTISGLNAKCSCDGIEYSLFTGVGIGVYTMKPYRVEILGNIVRVSN